MFLQSYPAIAQEVLQPILGLDRYAEVVQQTSSPASQLCWGVQILPDAKQNKTNKQETKQNNKQTTTTTTTRKE